MTLTLYFAIATIVYLMLTLSVTNKQIDKYKEDCELSSRAHAVVIINLMLIIFGAAWLPLAMFYVISKAIKKTFGREDELNG